MNTFLSVIVVGSYLEHLFYCCVCLFPRFMSGYTNPPKFIHKGLVVSKLIQSSSLLFIHNANVDIYINANMIVGIGLCSFGQLLNYHVYKEIGFNGVYYGILFGEKYRVAWSSNFPYNIKYIQHPQYIGAYMSYLGMYMCLFNDIYTYQFLTYVTHMTFSYIIIGVVEQYYTTFIR